MTNKQRVHAALEGRPVDRCPVTSLYNQLYHLDHFAELTGLPAWRMHQWLAAPPAEHVAVFAHLQEQAPFELLQPQGVPDRTWRERQEFAEKDSHPWRHDRFTGEWVRLDLANVSGHATDNHANETRFVEQHYGATWNDDWAAVFAGVYDAAPTRQGDQPVRLLVPWANEQELQQVVAAAPLPPQPFDAILARLERLQPTVCRHGADFAAFRLSVAYLALLYWRQAVVWRTVRRHIAHGAGRGRPPRRRPGRGVGRRLAVRPCRRSGCIAAAGRCLGLWSRGLAARAFSGGSTVFRRRGARRS